MKRILLVTLLLCGFTTLLSAQSDRNTGTIVKMRLGGCPSRERGFMLAISGSSGVGGEELCPEYTLVSEKVVFVIVGKSSTQLAPLAESTKFRFVNKEILIRIDDANHETHFMIKEMMLRADWERARQREEEEMQVAARQQREMQMMMRNGQ